MVRDGYLWDAGFSLFLGCPSVQAAADSVYCHLCCSSILARSQKACGPQRSLPFLMQSLEEASFEQMIKLLAICRWRCLPPKLLQIKAQPFHRFITLYLVAKLKSLPFFYINRPEFLSEGFSCTLVILSLGHRKHSECLCCHLLQMVFQLTKLSFICPSSKLSSLQTALANAQCLHHLFGYPHLSNRVIEGDSVMMPPGLGSSGLSAPGSRTTLYTYFTCHSPTSVRLGSRGCSNFWAFFRSCWNPAFDFR